MSKHRRTADDFVRDMKAKQQHSAPGDIERETSEGQTPQTGGRVARKPRPGRLPGSRCGG